MSLESQKPVRQDFVTKIRYMNNLPPPPLNPKFLKYNTTWRLSPKVESEELMSSLFRKENFTNLVEVVDDESSVNLNLINNRGFLDHGNESVIRKLSSKDEKDTTKPVQLHPKDRALLRDVGIGKVFKSEPEVGFLRRTEYISQRQSSKPNGHTPISPANLTSTLDDIKKQPDSNDPEAQLAAVERTFDLAQETLDDLTKLQHPTKKKLKAVSTWPLLLDTSMMDLKLYTLKFKGSASLSRETQLLKRHKPNFGHKNSFKTAIFRPITSEDGEWMSMYQIYDPASADNLRGKLNSKDREHPVNILDEQEDAETFKFQFHKVYDMDHQRFDNPHEELCIKTSSDEAPYPGATKKRKVAYYYPIVGKIDLKKHRASMNNQINKFISDSTADVINFKLREPNTNEMKQMDSTRSEFDPIEYEAEGEEDDEITKDNGRNDGNNSESDIRRPSEGNANDNDKNEEMQGSKIEDLAQNNGIKAERGLEN